MSAKVSKSLPTTNVPPQDIYLDFQPEAVAAPFSLRLGALTIDYIVAVMFPVAFLLMARSFGEDGAKLLSSGMNDTGWLIAIILSFCNMLVLPVLCGQTLGKIITGLRIVSINGSPALYRKLILRQTVGYFLTICTFGLGFIIAAIFPSRRALHDYISGTIVIFGNRMSK